MKRLIVGILLVATLFACSGNELSGGTVFEKDIDPESEYMTMDCVVYGSNGL